MSDRHPYASVAYAAALAGSERRAVDCSAWQCALIERPLPEELGPGHDYVGPYPLSVIAAGCDYGEGIRALRSRGGISLVLVSDPFGAPADDAVAAAGGTIRPFKTHYLRWFDRPAPAYDRETRRKIRKCLRLCDVREVRFSDVLSEWMGLYRTLCRAHGVGEDDTLPVHYFQAMAERHMVRAFAAYHDDQMVSMITFVHYQGCYYGHLAGTSSKGRDFLAHFGIYETAIQTFAEENSAGLLNLGGVAGALDDPTDGLARFKRSFSNDQTRSYLVKHVLDERRYAALCSSRAPTDFFPAYRARA